MLLPFEDKVFLCMPNFLAWQIRYHSVLDGKLCPMLTWWHMVKHESSVAGHGLFLKGKQLFGRMTGLCSKILRSCSVFSLQGPTKGPTQHPYLPLTLQAPLDLLDYMTQVIEQLSQTSLALFPTQNEQFRSLGKWAGITHQMRNRLPPKSKKTHRYCTYLKLLQGGPESTTYLSLYIAFLTCPRPLGSPVQFSVRVLWEATN